MAERRMFTQKITESDAFLEMPLSSQALYFHLCMSADDDGFVKNPKRIGRMIGSSDDDLKLLVAKSFVLSYESGVIVIKHWRMHNLLRKDRYNPTEYVDEKSMLCIKENGSYTLDETQGIPLMATKWQPNGNQMAPQDRIGKDSIDKNNNIYSSAKAKQHALIIDYLNSKTGSHYKPSTPKTVKCIDARMNEGFTVDDFKQVIDTMSDEWLSDKKMSAYLRPETLFGTKFESYLNRKPKASKPKVSTVYTDKFKPKYDEDEDLTVDISDLDF